jgi:hypothetical protein
MVMVIVTLLLGENHRLRGWYAVEANSPRLKTLGLSALADDLVTLTTRRRRSERSVLREAMAATATLQASNACSFKNRCVEAVVRWRQMSNVLLDG